MYGNNLKFGINIFLESKSADLLMCFSGRRAIQSLKQRNCVIRGLNLAPLCGTTTISMVLIIIGHRWGFRLPGPLQNYEVNEQVRFTMNYYCFLTFRYFT